MRIKEKQKVTFSLKQKAAVLTAVMALILTAVMFVFSLRQYILDMSENYAQRALQVANTVALSLDTEAITDYVDRVLAIYHNHGENPGNREYYEQMAEIEQEAGFRKLKKLMEQLETANEAQSIYIRAEDEERGRDVYIIDSDKNPESRFPTGYWQEFYEGEKTFVTKNDIMVYVNHLFMEGSSIGYMFTVEVPVEDREGNEIAFLGVDISIRNIETGIRSYIRGLVKSLIVLMSVVMAAVFWAVNRSVVKPLAELTHAASRYVEKRSRKEAMPQELMLSSLDIQTGDEIEQLGSALKTMEKELMDYGNELARVSKEQERIATELFIAAKIQASMLPKDFPERPEFGLYALMHPAKEVGGDFYDFFPIDEDHLALVIADVSGKGVAAALFMSVAKMLLKNSVRMGSAPAAVLEAVNNQLCENNEAELFVTVWLGIYEISSGKLTAANAGHEYPVIKRNDAEFQLYKDVHGFVLGGLENVHYREYELTMEPGDVLVVYTDGVPEATDMQEEQYGLERMQKALNSQDLHDAVTLIDGVKQDLDRFVGDAPQFDDVTMLCLIRRK